MPFKSLESLKQSKEEFQKGNVRMFEGKGLPYLVVPGCLRVISVRPGTYTEPIPNEIEMKVPVNNRLDEFTRVRVPMWELSELDGETILLRNELSNDGQFQANEKFFVEAEWVEEKAPPKSK